MAKTATTQNLGSSRVVEFTAEGIISLAWKKARMVNVRAEPDAAEREFARHWIMVKLDSLQSKSRIARTVVMEDVDLEESDGEYSLTADAWDVIGDAMFVDSDDNEVPVRPMTRDEWQAIPDKEVEGTPTLYYAEKGSTITLKLWPVPSEDATLRVQAVKWLRAATSDSNTLDLERFFVEYLITDLAYEIASANSIDLMYCAHLRNVAQDLLVRSLGAAKQRGPIQMVVKHRTGWI